MARQKIEVEIKIVGTQAQVKIKQLDDAFRDAATGADLMNDAIDRGSKLIKGSVGDLRRQIRALEIVRDNTAKTTKQYFEQEKQIRLLRNRVSQITDANSKYAKVNQDLISSSGLAGATLTELGRTISDMPYGIRGVTNNLSQLSTLFITLMAKTGGTTKALELLKLQLNGPLGIILAFQGVIAAIDFFFGSTKKAEEATNDLTDSIDAQSESLRIIAERLDTVNLGLEERNALINAASIVSSRLTKIQESENLTESQRNALSEKFIDLELQRMKLVNKREQDNKKLIDSQNTLKEAEKSLNEAKAMSSDISGTLEEQSARKALADAKESNAIDKKNAALVDEQTAQTSLISTLMALSNIQTEQNKIIEEATRKKKKDKDAVEELNAVNLEGLHFYEKFNELQERQRGIQDVRRNIEIANIKNVLAEEILALKKRSKSKEEFEKAKAKLIDEAIEKEIDSIETALKLDTLSVLEREKLYERLYKLKAALIDLDEEAEDGLDKILKVAREVAKYVKFGVDAITAQIDAEISQEERKTMLINNELKKRIINEKLSAEQKEAINNQIERNEIALQEKRDKLAEKAFKAQKAVSIVETLITTYEMAAKAYKALVGIPVAGPALATAAAAAATAFGLKQVDAISKTQFVPSAAPGSVRVRGLGGSAGGGTQDPTFNIVGTGQQFQLSQAIAQRTGEPVKAYVVTGDVRSGLALERNIIKGSKLG